jgi:heme oxygenase (mycobilin-producing)
LVTLDCDRPSDPGEAAVLALNRFVVVPERTAEFTQQAQAALAALAARPGFRDGELARCLDDPEQWCLLTRWQSVGAYRRALGDFNVRVNAVPLLAQAINEPSAYEALAVATPGGEVTTSGSDLAPDAARDHS